MERAFGRRLSAVSAHRVPATGRSRFACVLSLLPAAETPDKLSMGAATQSEPTVEESDLAGLEYKTSDPEPAGPEPIPSYLGIHRALRAVDPLLGVETPDPGPAAGRLLMYRADLAELDASTDVALTDPVDESSLPPDAVPATPTRRSKRGLGRLISLPGARRRREAAVRVQLEEAEARRVTLEQDHAFQVDTIRREADAARDDQVSMVETQAAEKLEAAVRAEREEAEARRVTLEQDHAAEVDAVRREADTAHATEVAAAETQAAERLEALRREAEAALAILASELEAQAEAQVEAAVREARDDAGRAAAETAQQHDAALAAVRGQLDDAEARRVKLEQDHVVQIDTLRREADIAQVAEVGALEAQAADQLAAAQLEAAAALAARETELASHAAARVEAAVREARDDAERKAAETAAQHDAALVAVRAQLDDAKTRRVKLEQGHAVQVATLRREADTARAAEVAAAEAQATERLDVLRREAEAALAILATELELQAAAQVEAAVRVERDAAESRRAELEQRHGVQVATVRAQLDDAEARRAKLEQDHVVQVDTIRQEADAAQAFQVAASVREAQAESAELLVETMKQNDVERASVRAEARADLARADDETEELKREVADAVRAATETARRHEVEFTGVRAQLEDAEERRAKLEQEHAVQVSTMRREANIAHLADVEALKSSAAEQVASAVRVAQTAAEQELVETMKQHDVAVASLRAQAQADASRAEDELGKLNQQVADTASAATETARRWDTQLAALRTELEDAEARRVKLEQDHAVRVDTVRREADIAHVADVAVLAAESAEKLAAAVRLTHTEAAQELVETMKQRDVAVKRVRSDARADVARAEDELAQLNQAVAHASRAASETVRQHDAELAAVQAQLEDAEVRRVKLGQEHAVRVDTVRRETTIAHAAEVGVLKASAVEQVASAVRVAQTSAEQELAATNKQHDVAVASLRAQAQADASRAEDELGKLNQQVTDTVNAATETARQHDAQLAALRTELGDAEARRVKLEQDHAVRVDTVRREADTAHAAEVAALEERAAEQVAAAVRAARADTASTSGQHALQRDSEVEAARADVTRAGARVTEVEQALTAVRREAELAQAEVARLRAEQAAGSPERSGQVGDQPEPQHADLDVQSDARRDGALYIKTTRVKREVATRRRMAEVTGGLVLAGFTGTLLGWFVALSRSLY